jgi:hypothetical protein
MLDARIPRQAPRRSRAERAEILERFHKSGLTSAAFAAREGMSLWALMRWLAEAKRTTTPEFIFSEIKMPPLLAPPSPWAGGRGGECSRRDGSLPRGAFAAGPDPPAAAKRSRATASVPAVGHRISGYRTG